MEICIFARFHARPGMAEAVSQAMLTGMIPSLQEPGCLGVQHFRSIGDPQLFFLFSRWKDVEAFERHAELPHTVRFLEEIEPLIDNAFDIYRTEQIR